MSDVDVAAELTPLIILGKVQHKWDCFGQEVVYDLFPVGTREEIDVKCSGLDQVAKRTVTTIFELAHSLTTVGRYNFDGSLEKKLQFIRAMQDPLLLLFTEELNVAKLKQREKIDEARKKLKKSSPIQP